MKNILNNINDKSIINTFIKLVKIDSLSYKEDKIIKYLQNIFKDSGLKVKIQKVDNTGNIVALLKGNKKGTPLFFNAHTDTVEPGLNIKPVITDKMIKSDGRTILGADDKSAIAVFIEGIKHIKKHNIKHPDIYFVLTYAEEMGLIGIKNFDFSLLKAKYGFSFDTHGPIGTAVVSAPTHYQYTITVHGKAAHAGIEPEKGVNAIKIGSKIIDKIKTGKIDTETTANIGKVSGGRATNIVPDEVVINGEVRSRNSMKLKKYISDLKALINKFKKDHHIKIKLDLNLAYKAYNFNKKSYIVKKFIDGCNYIKIKPVFEKSNGGSDSNIFNQYKFECLNLSTGMSKVHSTDEFILRKDLVKTLKMFLSIIINW